tara:strand:- start:368 stop:787 length:420 start_codon:yes stop_codon:yes gene_type:complete
MNLTEGSIMKNNYEQLKEMFTEMVVKKNASLIPKYYHPDFLLYSNGKIMDFDEMVRMHEDIYKTEIQYKVEYDEDISLEQDDKVAVRMYITTSRPDDAEKELELMLIAQYLDGKIYRVWELTFPDWSQDKKFQESLDKL